MTSDSLLSLAINFPPVELRPSRKEESRSIYNNQPFYYFILFPLLFYSLPLSYFILLFYVLRFFLPFSLFLLPHSENNWCFLFCSVSHYFLVSLRVSRLGGFTQNMENNYIFSLSLLIFFWVPHKMKTYNIKKKASRKVNITRGLCSIFLSGTCLLVLVPVIHKLKELQ